MPPVFPLLVEQLVAGTALLLGLMVAITAALFRAASGDVVQSTTTYVTEEEALGVAVDGEPGPVYGPGRHEIDPATDGETAADVDDWRTVRFTNGTTTLAWAHEDDGSRTDVEVALTVTDTETLWQQAEDVDRPVRNVLGQLLADATDDGTPLTELSSERIADRIDGEYGVTIEELAVERTDHS